MGKRAHFQIALMLFNQCLRLASHLSAYLFLPDGIHRCLKTAEIVMDDFQHHRFKLLRGIDRLTAALLGIRGAVVVAIDRAVIGVGFQLFARIAAKSTACTRSA